MDLAFKTMTYCGTKQCSYTTCCGRGSNPNKNYELLRLKDKPRKTKNLRENKLEYQTRAYQGFYMVRSKDLHPRAKSNFTIADFAN